MKNLLENESGVSFLLVLMLMLLSAIIIEGSLEASLSGSKTAQAGNSRAVTYYETEAVLANTFAWLQANEEKLISPFLKQNFYSAFERTEPSIGDNDALSPLPTLLKQAGTNDSLIFTNDPSLGETTFPTTNDLQSGAEYNPSALFSSLNFGGEFVKLTLLDALPVDETKDFGPPPSSAPKTDFNPVYRIDAMSHINGGLHPYAFVTGKFSYQNHASLYGEDSIRVSGYCDSYNSDAGAYGVNNRNAGCRIESKVEAVVPYLAEIYGAAASTGEVDVNENGLLCANFDSGCPDMGEVCQGEACQISSLPEVDSWDELCPTDQGTLRVRANMSPYVLEVQSSNPQDSCWDTLQVDKSATLQLVTTEFPYHFRHVKFMNRNLANIHIIPDTPGGKVELYIDKMTPRGFDGSMFVNTTQKPTQFTIYYLGRHRWTINEDDPVYINIIAPNAEIVVGGFFDFFGGISAKEVRKTNSPARIHLDEALGVSSSPKMVYSVRRIEQEYP